MPDDLGSIEERLLKKKKRKSKLFSGGNSVAMWEMINSANTVDDLRKALYVVCCRLQDLEDRI